MDGLSRPLVESGKEMIELAGRGPLVGTDENVHPGDIRPHNTGRLVSKFLKSFLPDA